MLWDLFYKSVVHFKYESVLTLQAVLIHVARSR